MNKKRIGFLALVILFIASVFIMLGMNKNEKTGLVIENLEISKDEYRHIMNQEKYEVTKYFHHEYGAEVNHDFWLTEFQSEIPYQMLIERTVEKLKLNYAIYQIAKEKGHIDSIDFPHLIERFELENQIREEKIENGEPVYGLAQYTLDLYQDYEMNTLQKLYTNNLNHEGMEIATEQSKQYFEEHKERLFVKNDDLKIDFIKIYYGVLDMEEDELKGLKEELKDFAKKLTPSLTMDKIIEKHEKLAPFYESIGITSAEFSARAKEMGDVFALAEDLDSGEQSHVIDKNGSLYLIHVKERVRHDYLPYDEVADNIIKTLREERYEEIISNRAKELSVDINQKELEEFTKKQVK